MTETEIRLATIALRERRRACVTENEANPPAGFSSFLPQPHELQEWLADILNEAGLLTPGLQTMHIIRIMAAVAPMDELTRYTRKHSNAWSAFPVELRTAFRMNTLPPPPPRRLTARPRPGSQLRPTNLSHRLESALREPPPAEGPEAGDTLFEL